MPMLLHAILLAVLFPATGGTPADPEPKCTAELRGRQLRTTIEFHDGYRLDAPWEVLNSQHLQASGELTSVVAELQLDQLIETDAVTGKKLSTALTQPVRLRLQAATDEALVFRAADTWCSTVIQARRGGTALEAPALSRPSRVT